MMNMLAQAGGGVNADPPLGMTSVVAPYMPVFFAAFFVALAITPIMRKLAMANGVVDLPDLHRKNHSEPVAYMGGVAIFLGWLVGVMFSYFLPIHATESLQIGEMTVAFPVSIILGAAAITLTGLFDDVYGISPRVKVGGQLFAAAALASEQVGIKLVGNSLAVLGLGGTPEIVVYALGTIVIALFVIGGCNALNLLDGLDGLASGVTAIAALGFLIIAAMVAVRGLQADPINIGYVLTGDPARLVMCLAILGAVLGFLPYNFNPASIFMGDAGSLLLGYLCVSTILLFSDTASRALLLVTACLIVFALPITDTALAIFRRKMRGQPIFSPDNQHIHHLLRRSGLSVKQSVLVLYGVASLFAALGITLVVLELRWRYVLAVFFVLFAFIFVFAYKYGRLLAIREQQAAAQTPVEPAGDPQASSENAGANPSNPLPRGGA